MSSKEEKGNMQPFLPPKKRTTGKKGGSSSNHVDYIMAVQGQGRSPATSPSDDDLKCTSDTPDSNIARSAATPDSFLASNDSQISTEQSRSPSPDHQPRTKKKVNICTEGSDDPLVVRTGTPSSLDSDARLDSVDCLTLSGTIKRGRKAGQSVDVRLNMSREELEVIEAAITDKNTKPVCCGIHILIFTIICLPFVTMIALFYNFYMGTLTWYNIFTYFSNGNSKIICSKILFPPFLILTYPFLIVLTSICLGFYAGFIQITSDLSRWKTEVQDLEKGFFGWVCSVFRLEDCSPYEVVIIMDIKPDNEIATQQT